MIRYVADALLFVALFTITAGVALMSWAWALIVLGIGLAALAVWMGERA